MPLPVVQRELSVAGRRSSTYWSRVVSASIALIVFFTLFLFYGRPPAQLGPTLLRTLSIFIFLECLLAGVRYTSDCISEERREGTLGLLFLTPLNSLDIVLGKMISRSISSVYNLLAAIPIFALSLLVGGVQGSQVLALSISFLVAIAFSLSAGIFVSSRGTHERAVLFRTLLFVALLTLLPPLLYEALGRTFGYLASFGFILYFSPAFLFNEAGRGFAAAVLPSSITILALSFGLIARSAWGLRATLQTDAPASREALPALPRIPIWFRHQLLKRNPVLWLALWGSTPRRFVFPLCVLAVCFGLFCRIVLENHVNWIIPIVVFGSYGMHALYKLALVAEISRRLTEDRRSGALELLLSTPLPVQFFLRGHMQATMRTWRPFLFSIAFMNITWMTHHEFLDEIGIFLPVSLFLLWPDTRALIWLSLRNSLHPWRYSRVVFQTWLRVLLAPILVLVLVLMTGSTTGMSNEAVTTIVFFWAVCSTAYDLFIIRKSMIVLRYFRSLAAGEGNPRSPVSPFLKDATFSRTLPNLAQQPN